MQSVISKFMRNWYMKSITKLFNCLGCGSAKLAVSELIQSLTSCNQGNHLRPVRQLSTRCIAMLSVMEPRMSKYLNDARLTLRVLRSSVVLTQLQR